MNPKDGSVVELWDTETEKAVTGHLSKASFVRNGVVQIPIFDPFRTNDRLDK